MYNKKYLINAIVNYEHYFSGEAEHIGDSQIRALFKTDYQHFVLVEKVLTSLYGIMTIKSPVKEEVLNYCKNNNIEVK